MVVNHSRVGYLTRSVYARRKLTYLTRVHAYNRKTKQRKMCNTVSRPCSLILAPCGGGTNTEPTASPKTTALDPGYSSDGEKQKPKAEHWRGVQDSPGGANRGACGSCDRAQTSRQKGPRFQRLVSPETPQSAWQPQEWSPRASSRWHVLRVTRSCRWLVRTCVVCHRPAVGSRTWSDVAVEGTREGAGDHWPTA